MEKIVDIRVVKKNLRDKYRKIRENMDKQQKKLYDQMIFEKIILLDVFKNAKIVFCFVSTDIEVETITLIKYAMLKGKKVAVPKCEDKNGNMNFYLINSFDDLEKSTFALLEPDTKICQRASAEDVNNKNSICVTPGFAYDRYGFRIGFGKGYYDRFLSHFAGKKIAVCYNECISTRLPHGKFDVASDLIVTPKYVITSKKIQ
ncbi:MAG: 5-formyltetrahydrofolate cyclo-ligase [Oscillospiraceae bacterium]